MQWWQKPASQWSRKLLTALITAIWLENACPSRNSSNGGICESQRETRRGTRLVVLQIRRVRENFAIQGINFLHDGNSHMWSSPTLQQFRTPTTNDAGCFMDHFWEHASSWRRYTSIVMFWSRGKTHNAHTPILEVHHTEIRIFCGCISGLDLCFGGSLLSCHRAVRFLLSYSTHFSSTVRIRCKTAQCYIK